MKAFVIKNKEGLYYTTHLNYEDIHTEDISEANIFNKEIANGVKLFLNKTTCEKWKVIGITIEEGDLEQQLANYKEALELACESVGNGIVYKDIGTNQELNAEQLAQMFIEQAKKELEE